MKEAVLYFLNRALEEHRNGDHVYARYLEEWAQWWANQGE